MTIFYVDDAMLQYDYYVFLMIQSWNEDYDYYFTSRVKKILPIII